MYSVWWVLVYLAGSLTIPLSGLILVLHPHRIHLTNLILPTIFHPSIRELSVFLLCLFCQRLFTLAQSYDDLCHLTWRSSSYRDYFLWYPYHNTQAGNSSVLPSGNTHMTSFVISHLPTYYSVLPLSNIITLYHGAVTTVIWQALSYVVV